MKNIIRIITISCFFLLTSNVDLFGQGWGRVFYGAAQTNPEEIRRNDLIEFGDYIDGETFGVTLYPEEGLQVPALLKVNANELLSWQSGINPSGNQSDFGHLPTAMLSLASDSILYLTERYEPDVDNKDLFLVKYFGENPDDLPTTKVWLKPVFQDAVNIVIGADLKLTLDGNYISLGAVKSEILLDSNKAFEIILVKSDTDGEPIWSQTFNAVGNDTPVKIILDANGDFWVLKNNEVDGVSTVWLMKIDGNGAIISETNLNTVGDVALDIIPIANNEFVITGNNAQQDLFVQKIDSEGNELWRQDYAFATSETQGRSIIEDSQNNLVAVGRLVPDVDGQKDGLIAKLTPSGIPLWERIIEKENEETQLNDIVLTPTGNYLIGGFRSLSNGGALATLIMRTDTLGLTKGGAIEGNIFHDFDFDCTNIDELNLKNWKVQAVNDSLNYFANTDEFGNYKILVQAEINIPVDYVVSVIPPSNYWSPCENDIAVSVNYLDTVQVDFPINTLSNCPYMEVQVSNSNFRPCEPATLYLDYCNNGTIIADDASIEVILDDYLTYDNASITPTQIDGQMLTFDLGDIDYNECGSFHISVSVDCDSVMLGDVLCTQINVFPDTLCPQDGADWTGALLQADYYCENDSIYYNIKNVGTDPMLASLEYIIIEDAVLLGGDNYNLDTDESINMNALPINGATYHLVTQQEPNAPGPMIITLGANDCPNDNLTSYNELPQYSGDPLTLIHCPVVVGSFDPNDKLAIPSGLGEDHSILPNTDIQYTIRFQNTGTDTAFRVVIRDVLSEHLDPASIVPGPSSHPYEWRFGEGGEREIVFNFYNIELPDSTTNLAASQGFVSFKISQKNNLPDGTLIENDAGIYFDFNEPIITNTTFHSVNRLIDLVSGSVALAQPEMQLSVMPNPMQQGAWIILENNNNLNDLLELNLFDMNGRQVRTIENYGNKIWLDRGNLETGMYFFTIKSNNVWQASGKIMVH